MQSEWRAQQLEKAAQSQANRTPSQQRPAAKHMTVADVILRYWRFAETYYAKNGEPTHELSDLKCSLRPVRRLYGDSYAAEQNRILHQLDQQIPNPLKYDINKLSVTQIRLNVSGCN